MKNKAIILISNDASHPALSEEQYEFSYRINRLLPLTELGYEIVVVSAGGKTGRNGRASVSSLKPSIRRGARYTVITPPILRLPMLWVFQSLLVTPLLILVYCAATNTKPVAIFAGSVVYGAIAKVTNRFLKARFVVDYGDPDFARERSLSLRVLRFLEKYVILRHGADAITCVDPNISAYLESRYGTVRSVFLPPGGYWKVGRGPVRSGKPQEWKSVIYAGHVAPPPVYRLDILVEAAADLIRVMPKTRFTVVGSGAFLPRMRELTVSRGVRSNFEFTGEVSYDEAKRRISDADVAVQLLSDMCMGTKVMDYFALGKAVVCTGSFYNSYSEFLRDGENCILVPADARKLSEALIGLLENDVLREKLGRSARKTIQPYDWESQARKVLEMIGDG